LQALARLRDQGWRLAIVTNGSPDNQLGKIHRTGLADCVDAWVVSGELGVRKPARKIFDAAARRCGASLADGGWAIGDSPALDVVGGRAAGLTTGLGQQGPAVAGGDSRARPRGRGCRGGRRAHACWLVPSAMSEKPCSRNRAVIS
jgi:FMN phosphatase YigB (HAD superfamily)